MELSRKDESDLEVLVGEVVTDMEMYRPTPVSIYAPGPEQIPRLVSAWLSAQRSPNTAAAYKLDIEMWFQWLNRWSTPPLEVRRVHADKWARWMEIEPHGRNDRPASRATVNRRLASISSFYDYAAREGVIEVNRVKHSTRNEIDKRHSETFCPSLDEGKRILAEARNTGCRTWAFANALVFTGARVSEVLDAHIVHLRTDNGRRYLRVTRKGGKVAKLWFKAESVGPAIDEYLSQRAQNAGVRKASLSGPIFLNRAGGMLTRQAAGNEIQALGARVGCPDLTPHSLRHLFATLSILAGTTKDDLQEHMGHMDAATTERYIQAMENYDSHPGADIAKLLGVSA